MFAHSILGLDISKYHEYLPYLVGCGVATGVFLIIVVRKLLFGRARELAFSPNRPTNFTGQDDVGFGDRRNTLRREGQPVLVHISSPAFQGATRDGWVLDRSTGGLRLRTDAPVAKGTIVQMLAENAPDTTPWVTAIVRSCKPIEQHFELGCEFETTPPWNVLLLFG